ncbi:MULTISPECIES: hypothetical protein [unclassified Sphingopyxis]|uniref:hypothetical protein n=1 Tax=unclassified Sphingopyxis TaxID=2614943 RepID=UPI000736AC3B|nr:MULTISPECIES: hypothetical protein [unclassified Sphingopyxis]KTE40048.1 hypothetical protein ATE62_08060 [Sphingopyxis sp. HIX]KTE85990.1 hypothetical protein ATE72_00025 [Sphingopyxis sp. HXXIV]
MRIGGMMAALTALTGPVAAEAQTPPDAAALKAIEAKVPPQGWYPEGYYDVRIAAEAQVAEHPRAVKDLVFDWDDGNGKRYDIIDCSAEYYTDSAEYDAVTLRYVTDAVDISRIRSELERLGFPLAVYAEPLAAFERARVEAAAKLSEREVRIAAGVEMPAEDEPYPDDVGDYEDSAEYKFVQAVEANRKRLAPKLPAVTLEGGCGAGDGAPVIVKTSPPGGEVLLVNAFAFKVCTRKKTDPWDRFACKWNEIETGVEKQLSGRYVYQVKWPDGVVRKGTREIIAGPDGDPASTVTFRKTGS